MAELDAGVDMGSDPAVARVLRRDADAPVRAELDSRRMLERYSHVRMEAKRTAMEALTKSSKMGGYDTSPLPGKTLPI